MRVEIDYWITDLYWNTFTTFNIDTVRLLGEYIVLEKNGIPVSYYKLIKIKSIRIPMR